VDHRPGLREQDLGRYRGRTRRHQVLLLHLAYLTPRIRCSGKTTVVR
jgi:hypothetical protein